jgi:uncharacterized membrane protein YvlD (DUF360 family)
MVYLTLNWMMGTTALAVLAIVFPGFRIEEFQSVLIAAAVVGLFHAAGSAVFWPAAGLAGVLLALADAVVFRVVALLVPGFAMLGFYPALAGGLLLMLLNLVMIRALRERSAAAHTVADS